MELLNSELAYLILLMLVAGALAGIAAGLFGIGGGLIVVPALIMFFPILEVPAEYIVYMAIGTSLSTIIFTSFRSAQAHHKKGSVDFQIIKIWWIWLVLGAILGIIFAANLKAKMIMILFASFLFILSFKFIFPNILKKIKLGNNMPGGFLLAVLGIFLGSSSALFGIGGGSISIMIMSLYGIDIHKAIGTASALAIPIVLPGAIGFVIMGWGREGLPVGSFGFVSLIGLVGIVMTSMFAAPLGAKLAHKLNPITMKKVFGFYILFTALNMFRKNLF